ncbi:MAG: response regulator transcription factor [Ktedonobacteraceae bacterium]
MFNAESKARILVVEDEADILQVLCIYLQYSGFEARGVKSGQEAIQVVPEFCPHLIVLDLMMQPISGWEVLDWLHANRITPPLPVLVITALNHLNEQVRGFEEGAVEYLTKPTQPGLIVERIRTVLSLTPEQRMMLRHQHMDEKRRVLERLNAPQSDEFIY